MFFKKMMLFLQQDYNIRAFFKIIKPLFVTAKSSNWHIIYTRHRYEKKVVEELALQGIEAYCPMAIHKSKWSDRTVKVAKPLFGSYMFVKVSEISYKQVLFLKGVVRYIYWCGKPALIADSSINEIKRWLNDFDHSQIQVIPLSVNDKVIIKSGPFQNQEAQINKINGNQIDLFIESIGIKISLKQNQTELAKAV